MKHPKVKYKIIQIQKIDKIRYAVKVQLKFWLFSYWRYVGYYGEAGEVILLNFMKEYETEEEVYKALQMYQQYGIAGWEIKVIQSN